jgi:hypothetical protein
VSGKNKMPATMVVHTAGIVLIAILFSTSRMGQSSKNHALHDSATAKQIGSGNPSKAHVAAKREIPDSAQSHPPLEHEWHLACQKPGLEFAFANKLARIAWAVLNKERKFECVRTSAMASRSA